MPKVCHILSEIAVGLDGLELRVNPDVHGAMRYNLHEHLSELPLYSPRQGIGCGIHQRGRFR